LKLAIAFGLINIASGSPLQIKEICGFVKIDTLPQSSSQKIVGRAIMARDANHFYHFEEGACSCMDYW
jgi:hypothetical protein